MNEFIDHKLPGRPTFQRKELVIGKERLEFYYRDVLESIRCLFGDPQYAQELVFAPERHYTSDERKSRVYHEMYTCDWWWTNQVRELHSGGTSPDLVKRKNLKHANQGLRSSPLFFPLTKPN